MTSAISLLVLCMFHFFRKEDTKDESRYNKKKSRDWSKMQDDISRLIVSKLRFYPHHRSFACASKEWYRVTREVQGPFQDGVPFLLLPYNYETQTCTLYDVFKWEKHEFHFPELSGKFVHASSNGWIAVMDDSDFELSLINPLTRRRIELPRTTDAIEYHEEKFLEWEEGNIRLHPMDPFSRYKMMTKVVVSQDGKTVAAIMADLSMVLMCRPGDGVDSWTILEEQEEADVLTYLSADEDDPPYSKPRPDWYRFSTNLDMIFFQGNLYVISEFGDVIIVDIGAPDFQTHYVRAPKRDVDEFVFLTSYLVECDGSLLLVYKKGLIRGKGLCQKTCTFEVYKFEQNTEKWTRIYDLGGKSLFVGLNGSISISASDFVGCRSNCIYFGNNFYFKQDAYQVGYQEDNGIFCLEDGNVEMFCISHSMPRLDSGHVVGAEAIDF